MKSAIEELMNGQFGNTENMKLPPERGAILDRLIESEEIIMKNIKDNPELLKAYLNLKDAIDDRGILETNEYYKIGFRSGFLLALDVLKDD